MGAFRELGGDFLPVFAVSADWADSFRLLQRHRASAAGDHGPDLSAVHLGLPAAGDCGFGGSGDFGGGDVELERGAECAGLDDGDGLLEADGLYWSRWITVGWGGVLFAIALVAQNIQSVLESGLSIASIVYGCLLGVFLLGVLTKHVGERAAMGGMLAGLITNLYVKFGTNIAWTWYVLIGSAVTVATALLISILLREELKEERVQHG